VSHSSSSEDQEPGELTYVDIDDFLALKSGANTLVVWTVGKANELSVNAGVIDWK